MKSCIVKENYIGSAISKILLYTQTNILLLLYQDWWSDVRRIYTGYRVAAPLKINIRVGPDIIRYGRISDIETIRIPDIRQIFNTRYSVTLSDIGPFSISGRIPDIQN